MENSRNLWFPLVHPYPILLCSIRLHNFCAVLNPLCDMPFFSFSLCITT